MRQWRWTYRYLVGFIRGWVVGGGYYQRLGSWGIRLFLVSISVVDGVVVGWSSGLVFLCGSGGFLVYRRVRLICCTVFIFANGQFPVLRLGFISFCWSWACITRIQLCTLLWGFIVAFFLVHTAGGRNWTGPVPGWRWRWGFRILSVCGRWSSGSVGWSGLGNAEGFFIRNWVQLIVCGAIFFVFKYWWLFFRWGSSRWRWWLTISSVRGWWGTCRWCVVLKNWTATQSLWVFF